MAILGLTAGLEETTCGATNSGVPAAVLVLNDRGDSVAEEGAASFSALRCAAKEVTVTSLACRTSDVTIFDIALLLPDVTDDLGDVCPSEPPANRNFCSWH